RGKLLSFLQEKYGAQVENLRAATIREWLEQDDLEPGLRLLLETRLEAAKSSGAKYKRGIRMCGAGSRMRYTLQFCGAGRTGRSSGKGFQPHNMARPTMKARYIDDIVIPGIKSGEALDWPELYGGPNTACANALRHSIVAAPGNDLIVADYSNIESRVLAWLAGEGWKLDAYRSGQDLYKILYARFFGGSVETVTDHQRQSAKVVELSMGFGGGVGAFVTMAAGYQIDLSTLPAMVIPTADAAKLTKADTAWRRAIAEGNDYGLAPDVFVACDVLKQAYRESNSEINRLRYDIDSAVRRAVAEPGVSTVVGRCTIWCANSALLIQLPNGDRLVYYAPKLHTTVYTDPLTGKKSERQHLSYATARGKSWLREKAWAGLFLENIVQAVANRLLRDGIRAAHRNTLAVPAIAAFLETLPPSERTAICLHVHDELALDVPKGSYTLEALISDMTTNSPWAAGLPIAAEGWCNPRYGKR
ncbi:MAG TPA: DNA polymerase, partial [Candidatus Saccharimonadales bacterium]|nr:DNA polymerase [Candidatus Saccharimonadales bacterium]